MSPRQRLIAALADLVREDLVFSFGRIEGYIREGTVIRFKFTASGYPGEGVIDDMLGGSK